MLFLHEYQRVDFPEGRNSAGSYMMTRLFQKHLFFLATFLMYDGKRERGENSRGKLNLIDDVSCAEEENEERCSLIRRCRDQSGFF